MTYLEISLLKLIFIILYFVFSEPEINREHKRKDDSAQLVIADPLTGHLKGAA